MIAQIAKYNDQQLLAAANCFLTNHQQQRLAVECNRSLVLTAVLTITALAEADFESLTAEVGRQDLVQTAVNRSLFTAEQVVAAQAQQVENCLNQDLTPVLGNPINALFEESIIGEQALLARLQLLFGEGQA